MNRNFYKDKICVVTGAASGIGFATTKLLLEEGAIVYALDRCPVNLSVKAITCDLSQKESIDDAFLTIPEHIDCFFGIAGVSGACNDYYSTFTINFIANKYITEEYLKYRMNPKGSICFVSSTCGQYWDKYSSEFRPYIKAETWEQMIHTLHKKVNETTPGILACPLSKRALNYYVALKSIEFGDMGVRVNSVLPASTNTKMISEFQKDDGAFDSYINQVGLANRFAYVDEIAKPILFLGSDDASFISGACLPIDYGNDAMIRVGKKRDPFDMKIGSKLFSVGFVQNKINKEIKPTPEDETNFSIPREERNKTECDSDGVEII